MNGNTITMSNDTIQDLTQLFNTVIKCWHSHPTHFGFATFDDFVRSFPNLYYGLLQYQQQLAVYQHAQQTQIQTAVDSDSQLEIESNSSVASVPSPQPQEPETMDETEQPKVIQQSVDSTQSKEEEKTEEEQKENPFSLLPTHVKQRKYRRTVAVPTLDVIEENKCSPSPSLSPLPPIPSPNLSPSPAMTKLNATAAEFRPYSTDPKYQILQEFVPRHAPRAKLNIYIPKHMTKTLLAAISEPFPNTNTLYYYLDISTALQINDHQMQIMQTEQGKKIVLVNYDLHQKDTKQPLYAVVTPNDEHKVEVDTEKWLWKVEEFSTEREIVEKYEIESEDFPKSSRLMQRGLYAQLKQQLANLHKINDLQLLTNYKWNANEIKQIGSSQKAKKGRKLAEIKAAFTVQEWINACQCSWNYLPAIPIIVYENREINQHWLEWVKLVYVQSQQCFVGLTFRFNDQSNSWQIESICLDKGDIQNKHRLLNLRANADQFEFDTNYDGCFEKFSTRITEIQWE